MAIAKRELTSAIKTALIIQGSLAVTFGVAAMFWPGLTALVLAYLFAVFLVADGSVLFIIGLVYWQNPGMVLRAFWGALQLLAGLFLLYHPEVTFTVLLVVLGASLIVRGIFGITHAVSRKHDAPSERTMHSVLGALGIIVGTMVLLQPRAGGLAFVWILGVYALITGVVLLVLSSLLPGLKATQYHKHTHRRAI